MWSKLSLTFEEWNASRRAPVTKWSFRLTFQIEWVKLETLRKSSERWTTLQRTGDNSEKYRKISRTSRFWTESLWSGCHAHRFSNLISLKCFQNGWQESMIKKNSPVESSTLSEKCILLSRTSFMTFQQVKSIIRELTKFARRHTHPTSIRWKSPLQRISWELLLPLNKERLGTTLSIGEERPCLKRWISKSEVATEMEQRRGSIVVTCIKDHPLSTLLPKSRISWLVTSSSSCTAIRESNIPVTFKINSGAIRCQELNKLLSLTITGSLSSKTHFQTQLWWLRPRIDSVALRRTEWCKGLEWAWLRQLKDHAVALTLVDHVAAPHRILSVEQEATINLEYLVMLSAIAFLTHPRAPSALSNQWCISVELVSHPFKNFKRHSKSQERATGEHTTHKNKTWVESSDVVTIH